MTVDTTMWIASCTKLMTVIAVLQCVEKKLLELDEPVWRFLPELADPDILYGFVEETGEPQFRKAKNKITMRHLLTHSSGLGYDTLTPALIKWRDRCKQKPPPPMGDIVSITIFQRLQQETDTCEFNCIFSWR